MRFHITPEQQVNTILRNLMRSGLPWRERDDRTFRYYTESTASQTKQPSDRVKYTTKVTTGKSPGESKEQKEAENWLMSHLSRKLGIKLEKKGYDYMGGAGLSWTAFVGPL